MSAVFAFIAAEKANYPVSLMARLLDVGRTSFHDWERRPPSDRVLYDAFLLEKIRTIHADSRGTYGAPRVHAELALGHGIQVGRKRVERLMAGAGLEGIPVPRKTRTTIRVAGVRCASDLVERDFYPTAPDRLWCADITYLHTWEGTLYLASVIDCYSRLIVGWAMADHMRLELVEAALQMAVDRRRPAPGVIHHSDHGSQLGFNRSSQQCLVGSRYSPRATAPEECQVAIGWATRLSSRRRERSECRSGDSRVRAVRPGSGGGVTAALGIAVR